MRKDIQIHIETNDIVLGHKKKASERLFKWVEVPGENRYIYGEIEVPVEVSEYAIRHEGLIIKIPYTPVYQEFKIRIRQVTNNGSFNYIRNQKDGTEWFTVRAKIYGEKIRNIFASELILISDAYYHIMLENNEAVIYTGETIDLNITDAERQNTNCMLACSPSNYYRYPISGVGLIRWVNAPNINNTNLADVLEAEFGYDGMSIKNAIYNYDTRQLELELENIRDNE